MIHKTGATNYMATKKKLKVFMYIVMGDFIAILLLILFCNHPQVSDLDFKPFEHTL